MKKETEETLYGFITIICVIIGVFVFISDKPKVNNINSSNNYREKERKRDEITKHNCKLIFEGFKIKESPFIPVKWEVKPFDSCYVSIKNNLYKTTKMISIVVRSKDYEGTTDSILLRPPSVTIKHGETFVVENIGAMDEKKYKEILFDDINYYPPYN